MYPCKYSMFNITEVVSITKTNTRIYEQECSFLHQSQVKIDQSNALRA
jgi:hypothetical protein